MTIGRLIEQIRPRSIEVQGPDLKEEARRILDNIYALKNEAAEVEGVLSCLMAEPANTRDRERIISLGAAKARLAAQITELQSRLTDLEQDGEWAI